MKQFTSTVSDLVSYSGDNSVKNLRLFFKSIERNMNNSINIENTLDQNKSSRGISIKIDQIKGLKKNAKDLNPNNKYFIRFFMNMCNRRNNKFYGNTYRGEKIEVKIDDKNEIKVIKPEPFYSYVLCPHTESDSCIFQIIFVETNQDEDIINQTCEGWTIFEIKNTIPTNADQQNLNSQIFKGSPRELTYKKMESLVKYDNAFLEYNILSYPKLKTINFLLPNYVILAYNEQLPGLLNRYLPKVLDLEEEIKTVNFEDIYFKNIEIKINNQLENQLISFANIYRKKKYFISENQSNKIIIKERRLKCGIHNTWCFINSNGLENSISLIKKDEITLYYKGVLAIDKFFADNLASCAFIIELNYTLSIPISPTKQEDLNVPIGYSVYVPDNINMDNIYRESYFITGPGVTVYGDELWDPENLSDRIIKIIFILSTDERPFDGTFEKKSDIGQSSIINQIDVQKSIDSQRQISLLKAEINRRNEMIGNLQESLKNSNKANVLSFVEENNIEATQSIPGLQVSVQTEVDDNLEGKKEEKVKEVIKYLNVPMGIITQTKFNENDLKEFNEFKSFQKTKNLFRSYENMSKNIEDDYQKNKIIYDKRQKETDINNGDLISKGILALDIDEPNENLIDYTLDKEIKGDELSNHISIQFLAYKPKNENISLNQIPNKLQFFFDFFNQQDNYSPVCIVNKPESDLRYYSNSLTLKPEGSELSTNNDNKIIMNLKFDPSNDNSIDYRDFIQYLLFKKMPIKVMDVDKNMCLGFIKVPLKDIIRQGKHQIYQLKQYEIYDNYFDLKGYIQLYLRNDGLKTLKQFNYDPKGLKYIDCKSGYNNSLKKKKVLAKPISMQNLSEEEKEKMGEIIYRNNPLNDKFKESQIYQIKQMKMEPEMEKKVRVLRYFNDQNELKNKEKLEEAKLTFYKNKKIRDEKNFQKLQMIGQFKDATKGNLLNRIIHNNHKNFFEISLILGQPYYFNYIITNPFTDEESFHVEIKSEEDENYQRLYSNINHNKNEFNIISLVHDPIEWENIINKDHNYERPDDFNIISNDNYFKINGNENIPLLFKLLTYEKSLDKKKFIINILKSSNEILYSLSVTIKCSFPIIDHIFQYYSACNSNTDIYLVNPFRKNIRKNAEIQNNYFCSDQHITLRIEPSKNNFYFNYEVKEEGYFHSFYFFLYLDPTQSKLYSTWKVEILSVELLTLTTNLGKKLISPLYIYNNDSSNDELLLQLFSNRETVFFPNENSNPFKLPVNGSKEIAMILYPKSSFRNEVIINCVNIAKRETYKTWLLKYSTSKPEINVNVNVKCIVGEITNIKYEFTNKLNNFILLKFDSDNEEVLNVVDTQVPFNANETKYVNISIPAQFKSGFAEVLVFVYDEEDKFSQTVLFKLIYNY